MSEAAIRLPISRAKLLNNASSAANFVHNFKKQLKRHDREEEYCNTMHGSSDGETQ
jgi:hypothetical protein